MVLVAIDFSINSAGVCIKKDDKLTWLNFAANVKFTNKGFVHHNAIQEFVYICPYERKVPKTSYLEEQQYKILNAQYLAHYIVAAIKDIAQDEEVEIAFEGFSYGSKGRSFIDLIAYNSFLKARIVDEFMETEIKVFAPSEIKKNFTGKGNCGKDKMFEAFLECKDKALKKDQLFDYCKKLEIVGGEIPKPLDDLVDSYAILRTLETHLSTRIPSTTERIR